MNTSDIFWNYYEMLYITNDCNQRSFHFESRTFNNYNMTEAKWKESDCIKHYMHSDTYKHLHSVDLCQRSILGLNHLCYEHKFIKTWKAKQNGQIQRKTNNWKEIKHREIMHFCTLFSCCLALFFLRCSNTINIVLAVGWRESYRWMYYL